MIFKYMALTSLISNSLISELVILLNVRKNLDFHSIKQDFRN